MADLAGSGHAARRDVRNAGLHRVAAALRPVAALGLVVALALAGCNALTGPTFAPSGDCVVDGRAAGAYPDLEAQVAKAINGRPATSVDSGRNCTPAALGSLASHGVRELHFAGATWDEGNGNGVSIARLALPGGQALPVEWVEEFYQLGAENGKHTGNIETSRPTYAGAGTVFRLDTLNDLSFQTVIVWRAGTEASVVIVATQVDPSASRAVHDARVAEAVGAAALATQPSPGCGCVESPVLPSAS